MLVHADGSDLIVFAIQIFVVAEFDRHPILQPEAPRLLNRILVLCLGQRDAMRRDAVVHRRVAQQAAPATADIEKPLARLKTQLPADHVELVVLRLGQGVVPVGEIGAGVLHLRIEEEGVEVVANIIVELDERLFVPVGLLAAGFVAEILLLQPDLVLRRQQQRQRPPDEETFAQVPGLELDLLAPCQLHEIQHAGAGEIDVAGGVVAQNRLHGRPAEDRPQHSRPADRNAVRVIGVAAQGHDRAVPKSDRERRVDLLTDMLENIPRCPRCSVVGRQDVPQRIGIKRQ